MSDFKVLILLEPSRCVFTKYSKSRFSQNTTNLLSIKVATYFDSRSHHQVNYWTMFELHQVKVHIFGIPWNIWIHFKPLNPELSPICYLLALLGAHHFLHVSRIRVKLLTFRLLMSYIYIYIYIYTYIYIYDISRLRVNINNIVNINLIFTHILSLLQICWDPKNVNFHLMYLKHGSIIGLMMTPWIETCRHFNW